MGLDMYLRVDEFVSGYDFRGEKEVERFNNILRATGLSSSDVPPDSPFMTIKVNVAYWRKANAIHHWFVQQCQEGRDECQETEVSREDLTRLRDASKTALDAFNSDDLEAAGELMPPTSGFFFGSTALDEWYASDLKNTVEQLDRVLSSETLKGHDWFIYQSSW